MVSRSDEVPRFAYGFAYAPKDWTDELSRQHRDLVTFVETEGGVVIKPAEIVVSAALDEIGEALKERGLSLEELMERGREIRANLIEEEYDITDPDHE